MYEGDDSINYWCNTGFHALRVDRCNNVQSVLSYVYLSVCVLPPSLMLRVFHTIILFIMVVPLGRLLPNIGHVS